jgi:hypothetical protein
VGVGAAAAEAVVAVVAVATDPTADPKFKTYSMMRKMHLPEGAIRQKMLSNGVSDEDIAVFFGEAPASAAGAGGAPEIVLPISAAPPTPPTPPADPTADPKFKTYNMMRKMHLPEGAIRQKMLSNGVSDGDIAVFFGEAPAPAATPAVVLWSATPGQCQYPPVHWPAPCAASMAPTAPPLPRMHLSSGRALDRKISTGIDSG